MKVEYIVYLDILMMTEHLLLKTAWIYKNDENVYKRDENELCELKF